MNTGQSPSITPRAPGFSLSGEVRVCLAVVLACHLCLVGFIVLNGAGETPDITPPMTGILLSGGAGPGTGANGNETGGPVAGGSPAGSSAGMVKPSRTNEFTYLKESRAKPQSNPASETIAPENQGQAHNPETAESQTLSAAAGSSKGLSTGSSDGNGTGTGTGTGTAGSASAGDGSGHGGKGGNGFSGPHSDAGFFSNPKPPYPPVSRRMGEEGNVLLSVHILADGRVDEIRLKRSSGFSRLDDSAMKTVRHWRYVPAKRNGKPIPYWYVQPIRFSLDD